MREEMRDDLVSGSIWNVEPDVIKDSPKDVLDREKIQNDQRREQNTPHDEKLMDEE
eukprot:CAMPEP_0116881318 /NCGR_PEP_ID=MMETSP0463-20121206/13449_1 /TAXON_ID=181622 /ORGANISM="Strombidinopsis sp, Strain SopsisLIS2011" /LENGTH=55 /DNA_ID=CAMNT_0004533181 /DNA_START=140 /DNA_END=307 /DNA_ORIENTATION=+